MGGRGGEKRNRWGKRERRRGTLLMLRNKLINIREKNKEGGSEREAEIK